MNIAFDFTGRTVLVTGAAQGIGLEVAKLFHDSGAHVVPLDRDADVLAQSWPADARRVRPIVADVADRAAVDAAVARAGDAGEWTGSLDVVINNAGITRDAVVWKMASEQWRAVLDVHLTGTFNVTHAAIPPMRVSGRGEF